VATAVRLVLQSQDVEDTGIGIVIARQPLVLLVPEHVLVLLEEGIDAVLVDGETFTEARRLPAPALEKDHLALIQLGRKGLKNLMPVRLPRKPIELKTGQPIRVVGTEPSPKRGSIAEILSRGDGHSVITDIDIRPGESGSALMIGDELVGICQGRKTTDEGGRAVGVPLSPDALRELRRVRNRRRVRTLTVLTSLLLAAVLAIGGVAVRSSVTFALAGLEIDEDKTMITVQNAHLLTFRPSWSRTFETGIFTSTMIARTPGGVPECVGVGTKPEGMIDGAFVLLDENGRELWRYSVPQGECIYKDEGEVYDLFLVTHIVPYDLDGDGEQELIVVFVHNNFYPTKMMVFEMSGEILAEYWHPGYFRTIAVGPVGDPDSSPMVVISGSNNRIQDTWWHPQTLFAFRGLDISGQAPPYTGVKGRAADLAPGSELWYRVFQNVDGEVLRAKCRGISIGDYTGDGRHEIRATTTDGRFYYLNGEGETLWIDIGDRWLQEFGDMPALPLIMMPLAGR